MNPRSRERNTRKRFTRKVDNREVRQRFLIVCEGIETEPNYFRSFRVSKEVIDIDIKGLGKNPTRLVDCAIDLKAQDDYDRVWCVFDRDNFSEQDFNSAITNAKKHDIQIAYSNEAFELWYVLHFNFLDTGIPRTAYCQKLTKYLKREYYKNSETIYEELFQMQPTAIKNAKKLLAQYNHPNPAQDNPSTTVHLLVEEPNKFIP